MALASIVLLLLSAIQISFIHLNAVQDSPKYVTYQKRMPVLNKVISLAPSAEPVAGPSSNPHTSNGYPTNSPANPPTTALAPDSPSPPNGSESIFDVRSNGAVGDGKTDDTKAFTAAWNSACNKTDQAKILVPKGYSFLLQPTVFSGPCQNSIIFQVDGTIVAQSDPKSWTSKQDSWLEFNRVNGLTLQGGGLLDGNGEKWWSCESCTRPVGLRFCTCKDLTVRGTEESKLNIKNSPQFHVVIDEGCQNVTVDSISIVSPATSPNTDGIHIASKDIFIRNSYISSGDDCVSMSNGSENIHIENMDCRDGHGISIGSLGKDDSEEIVKNITVINCFIADTQNGVRIKTWASGSGSVSNVKFENIQMSTVTNPIIIDQYYCPENNCSDNASNSELLISDVTYQNITGTYNTDRPAVYLNCSNKMPCVNITIVNMQLSSEGSEEPTPVCSNVSAFLGKNIKPAVTCLRKGSSNFFYNLLKKDVKCINS